MRKSKPQFKTVDFSERSSDDFRKYIKGDCSLLDSPFIIQKLYNKRDFKACEARKSGVY